jgi:hypothetical protein
VESSCECCYEPSGSINAGKLSSGYTIGGLSSSSQFHRVSYQRPDTVFVSEQWPISKT